MSEIVLNMLQDKGIHSEAVSMINFLLRGQKLTEKGIAHIQRFVTEYEELTAYRDATCGLWATDEPTKLYPKGRLFELTYEFKD